MSRVRSPSPAPPRFTSTNRWPACRRTPSHGWSLGDYDAPSMRHARAEAPFDSSVVRESEFYDFMKWRAAQRLAGPLVQSREPAERQPASLEPVPPSPLLEGAASPPSDTPRADDRVAPPEQQKRLSRRSVAAVLLLAAVAVLALVLLGIAVMRLRAAERLPVAPGSPAPEAREATGATSEASSTTEDRRQVDPALLSLPRLTLVLASPDLRRIRMNPYGEAPAALGHVLWSSHHGIALAVIDLPAAQADRVYQAWLVTPDGSLSLGILEPDASGSVTAAFDSPPVTPELVRGFMVTVEPPGGSNIPGRRVALAS